MSCKLYCLLLSVLLILNLLHMRTCSRVFKVVVPVKVLFLYLLQHVVTVVIHLMLDRGLTSILYTGIQIPSLSMVFVSHAKSLLRDPKGAQSACTVLTQPRPPDADFTLH